MLDNILPGDILLKARELHFNNDTCRAVLLVRVSDPGDSAVFDTIQNLFPDKTKDFVININETDIALVKEVNPNIDARDLEKLARSVADALGNDYYTRTLVGIGTAVVGMWDVARAFNESRGALEGGTLLEEGYA